MKATAIAPANIAFIKYWGKKDEKLRLPINGSVSMNLSNLTTTTTVEFSASLESDSITINKQKDARDERRVIKHLDRIRKLASKDIKAKVVTENNFPTATGLSSSASGFAALSVAGAKAAGLELSERELSILARQGSGSACRSIPAGFVEWLDGDTSKESYSITIHPPGWWDIVDIVAVVARDKKDISTTQGHKLADTSPFFQTRLAKIGEKIIGVKKAIRERDFAEFGEIIEAEALELHAIMITSRPSLLYWLPGTIQVMKAVKKGREESLQAYFTVNTGQDIHIICEREKTDEVVNRLKKISEVKDIIINKPAQGARLSNKHLF